MTIPPTMRDKALAAVAAVVAFVAIAVCTWFLFAEGEWSKARRTWTNAVKLNKDNDRLVSQKAKWKREYEAERDKMPVFEKKAELDTYWLSKVENLARENNVFLESKESKEEGAEGEVFEQFIEFKKWEGGLEQIVKFLYALESDPELMSDVDSITMRTDRKKGWLRGSLRIKCAYMRDDKRAAERKSQGDTAKAASVADDDDMVGSRVPRDRKDKEAAK